MTGVALAIGVAALLVVGIAAGYAYSQNQAGNQPTGDSVLSVAVTGGNDHLPDLGPNYTFTAYISPRCQPGQPCPDYISTAPSSGVTWTFGDGTSMSGNPVSHEFPGFVQWSQCFTATAHYNGMTASVDAQTGGPATC